MIDMENKPSGSSGMQLAGPASMPLPMSAERRARSEGGRWGIKTIIFGDSESETGDGGMAGSKCSHTLGLIQHFPSLTVTIGSFYISHCCFLSVMGDVTRREISQC